MIEAPIVTPVFKEIKGTNASVIGFLAKKARGTMARYIIQNKVESPENLKLFSEDRYKFQASQSDDKKFVFTRKFIPVGK